MSVGGRGVSVMRAHHTHTPPPPVGVWCDIHTPPVWGCGAGGGGGCECGGGGRGGVWVGWVRVTVCYIFFGFNTECRVKGLRKRSVQGFGKEA